MIRSLRIFIKKINHAVASAVLFLFYIFIFPFSKALFLIVGLGKRNKADSYWQSVARKDTDLDSPY